LIQKVGTNYLKTQLSLKQFTSGSVKFVEDWPFSTVKSFIESQNSGIPTSSHVLSKSLNFFRPDILQWLDQEFSVENYEEIKMGLSRAEFIIKQRASPLQEFL
jgi:hypothetical protein